MRMLLKIAFRALAASIPVLMFGMGCAASPAPSSTAKPASCVMLHQDMHGTMRSKPLTLGGQIQPYYYLGPPGYGENPRMDRKDPGAILVLDHPLNICFPKPTKPLTMLQKELPSLYKNVKRLGGMSRDKRGQVSHANMELALV